MGEEISGPCIFNKKDTSNHGLLTVYRTVLYAHAYEYASMYHHSPHILASAKDMYVTLTVIVLKYSKHSSPKAQEKTLAAIQCTPNMIRSSKPMWTASGQVFLKAICMQCVQYGHNLWGGNVMVGK